MKATTKIQTLTFEITLLVASAHDTGNASHRYKSRKASIQVSTASISSTKKLLYSRKQSMFYLSKHHI